jgi:uncharacterized membrane protein
MNDRFPLAPGFVAGAALIGFFDGIVFHQLLQWHHMICIERECVVRTVATLERQTLYDGMFHAAMWLVLVVALVLLTRAVATHAFDARRYWGAVLAGAGVFNVVEGIVDHYLLGIHHVRFGPGRPVWDAAFLIGGAALALAGAAIARDPRRRA